MGQILPSDIHLYYPYWESNMPLRVDFGTRCLFCVDILLQYQAMHEELVCCHDCKKQFSAK